MDRGAWRATDHGVTRGRHGLATKPPPPPLHDLYPSVYQNISHMIQIK